MIMSWRHNLIFLVEYQAYTISTDDGTVRTIRIGSEKIIHEMVETENFE